MSGQLPNRVGNSLAGLPQQQQQTSASSSVSSEMQNSGANQSMEPELYKARRTMYHKIYEFFMRRNKKAHEVPRTKMIEIVKALEERLYRGASTKEEYMNMATLERRLHVLIKRPSLNNQRQQLSHVNSSSSISTMIPTPGMPQSGNSSPIKRSSVGDSKVISNDCNSSTSSVVSSGNFLPTTNAPAGGVINSTLSPSDGPFSKGYQQLSSSVSSGAGGNSMVTSMGPQRVETQMIPSPGFNKSSIHNINKNTNYQSYTSNNVGTVSSVGSTLVSQHLQKKPHSVSQNNHLLHKLGTHMGGGARSDPQQTSHRSSNGALNSGIWIAGNSPQLVNGPGISQGYVTPTVVGNSPKYSDQHEQSSPQGEGCAAGSSGSGNLCVPITSIGLMTKTRISNPATIQSKPETNSHLMTNQLNLHTVQRIKRSNPQSVDHLGKMSFPSQTSFTGNLVQSHQLQQFQQQQIQHQLQENQQSQHHQSLLENQGVGPSHPSPDVGIQMKSKPGMESHDKSPRSQAFEKIHFSDTKNRFSQDSLEDHARGSQVLSLPSDPQNSCSSETPTSEPMQQFLHQNHVTGSQSSLSSLPIGVQSNKIVQGQSLPKSLDGSPLPVNLRCELNVQEDFQQRITSIDEAQKNNLLTNVSINGQDPLNICSDESRSINLNRERRLENQQKWLLCLMHARRCTTVEGKCSYPNCMNAQKVLKHVEKCSVLECPYPHCRATRVLTNHLRRCRDASCPICIPVKKEYSRSDVRSPLPSSVNGSCKRHTADEVPGRSILMRSPGVADNSEVLEPSLKRMKIVQSVMPETETTKEQAPTTSETHIHQEAQLAEQHCNPSLPLKSDGTSVKMECPVDVGEGSPNSIKIKTEKIDDLSSQRPGMGSWIPNNQEAQLAEQHCNPSLPLKSEGTSLKMECPVDVGEGSPKSIKIKTEKIDDINSQRPDISSWIPNNHAAFIKQESMKVDKEVGEAKQESVSLPSENAGESKSGKPKIRGVSLTELFTAEQVREHIRGLRQWIGQSKAKVEKNQAMGHSMNDNSCQLCGVERLTFEPPPIYCSPCGARIKRNVAYYTIGAGDTRHSFCSSCYNETRGESILVNGTAIPRGRLEKKKHDEEIDEWWVQCDKCEAWQHQICALFNGRRNDGGQAEYTCPNCYVEEVQRGERYPLPENAVLGAKDLPRTILSDHIEKRLARKLNQERKDRARVQGKSYDEVPGAEGLVVRIVSSVDKKVEVKPRFLDMFKKNYPSEFPYKSKVLLLFQKIEGVEVCLFGMYVQEYGSECQQPNHRRVYLSYVDSVKYFRPDVKTITGEALRTYVYHEIMIGYLEYCKMRGFTSCYIWACPPLKGEDYILYCHPEIQKTPKSDKLREWYSAMLRKAAKEKLVVDTTNLYDHFFMFEGESTGWVTAAKLPYFDGDYWPGAAEDMIYQLQREEEGMKQHKKGTLKKSITKTSLKASGDTDIFGKGSKDALLMRKLGETICPMKEDFIMVHLQHPCTRCFIYMVSGNRWVCNQCKNFQLCDKCFRVEKIRAVWQRHPSDQKEMHELYPVEINNVPADTKDKDENLESEFFDTRQAFLSLCQGNHYQYDTLRRAKHSSMMVLYHLHNPTAPAFVTTCDECHLDIQTGQGWRCETCPDYDVCNACHQKDGGIDHPHKLTKHPSVANCDAQNKEARQLRALQVQKILDLVVHATQCRSPYCQYTNCLKMKALFRHGINCKIRTSGGCGLCKRFWFFLRLHAQSCKETECHAPRCRDLKENLKRLQQQSETRQRASIRERMRQRAAEVSYNS